MKYIRRTSRDITDNFLEELLKDRNIINDTNKQSFFNPSKTDLIDPMLLDNIEAAADCFLKHLEKGSRIYLVIDPDVDGFTSSAVIYLYMMALKQNFEKFSNFTIDYHVPDGKAHGLEMVMNELEDSQKYDLIILPDSSSNDYEYHSLLKGSGYEILVLDHHLCEKYSEDAIVVNNQLSEYYSNKELSGVGVVYKFIKYCDEILDVDFADYYLDLVALGIISDMMEITTLENRYICDYGLTHINNLFLTELINKQSYSLGGELNQIGIAFYITPLINSLIRMGNIVEKENLFKAFINSEEIVPSTKRGEKGMTETLGCQVARNCVNAKSRQNREKDKALELLDIQIIENCLDENKILILDADDLNISNTLTGLCAMGVVSKYKKPVLLGRKCPDNTFKGSIRGVNESELKDLKSFLEESGYMDYVQGHANAAGFGIAQSKIDKLIQYANEKLKNINFNEGFYEADFIVKGNCSYLGSMIEDLDKGKKFFGQGNAEPIIIVENISLDKGNLQVIGSNKDTLKFSFNGVTYIKFKATKLINELNDYSNKLSITVAGRGNINEWGGNKTPQILIDEIEIKNNNEFEF